MDREAIIAAGFPVIREHHRIACRKYRCGAYLQDRLWDCSVDVLLSVSRTFKPGGERGLAAYIRWACDRHYRQLLFRRRFWKRQHAQWGRDSRGRLIQPRGFDTGQDQVDGADLMPVLNRIGPEQKAALLGHCHGRQWKEMGEEWGLAKQLVQYRANAGIREARELLGLE